MLFGVTTVGDVHHPLRPCFQGSLGRGQFFSVARVVQHFGLLQQRGAGQVNLQLQLRSRLKQLSCHHGFRRDIGQPRDRQEDEGHQRLHAQDRSPVGFRPCLAEMKGRFSGRGKRRKNFRLHWWCGFPSHNYCCSC